MQRQLVPLRQLIKTKSNSSSKTVDVSIQTRHLFLFVRRRLATMMLKSDQPDGENCSDTNSWIMLLLNSKL